MNFTRALGMAALSAAVFFSTAVHAGILIDGVGVGESRRMQAAGASPYLYADAATSSNGAGLRPARFSVLHTDPPPDSFAAYSGTRGAELSADLFGSVRLARMARPVGGEGVDMVLAELGGHGFSYPLAGTGVTVSAGPSAAQPAQSVAILFAGLAMIGIMAARRSGG